MKGTLILAVSGFSIKLVGVLFKFVLARIIGDEGFGLYTRAYSLYTPILVLFVSGIPVAISHLSATESMTKGKTNTGIFTTMLTFNAFFGLFLAGSFMLGAKMLAGGLLGDIDVYPSLIGIGPAILIGAILAVFRGYFQGLEQMTPTAVSQFVEQLVRVASGLVLVSLLIGAGPAIGASGVTIGSGIGGLAGLIVLIGFYIYGRRSGLVPKKNGKWIQLHLVGRVMKFALPVTLGALAISLMQFLDGLIIPRRLEMIGYLKAEVRAIYGGFGMANSLVIFPTIIATALAVNLIPAIAKSNLTSKKLTYYRIGEAVKWGAIVSFPASIGLFLLAEPLSWLLFRTDKAILPLQVLCWTVPLISLQTVITGIIQGLGNTYLPARNLFIGGIFNGVINYSLTPIFGIRGAALGTVFGYLISLCGNLRDLKRQTGFKKLRKIIMPSIMASLGMGGVLYLINWGFKWGKLARAYQVTGIVLIGVVSYFLLLVLFKGITRKEMKKIIFGERGDSA